MNRLLALTLILLCSSTAYGQRRVVINGSYGFYSGGYGTGYQLGVPLYPPTYGLPRWPYGLPYSYYGPASGYGFYDNSWAYNNPITASQNASAAWAVQDSLRAKKFIDAQTQALQRRQQAGLAEDSIRNEWIGKYARFNTNNDPTVRRQVQQELIESYLRGDRQKQAVWQRDEMGMVRGVLGPDWIKRAAEVTTFRKLTPAQQVLRRKEYRRQYGALRDPDAISDWRENPFLITMLGEGWWWRD